MGAVYRRAGGFVGRAVGMGRKTHRHFVSISAHDFAFIVDAGGGDVESNGVQGSNGITIFDLHMVSTGYSVQSAPRFGLDVKYTDIEDTQKPAFMKDNDNVKTRIVYDAKTRRIVGAQMSSTTSEIGMAIHMFSLAIAKQVTIDELALLDLFFLPHYNQPYNYINKAAAAAE